MLKREYPVSCIGGHWADPVGQQKIKCHAQVGTDFQFKYNLVENKMKKTATDTDTDTDTHPHHQLTWANGLSTYPMEAASQPANQFPSFRPMYT